MAKPVWWMMTLTIGLVGCSRPGPASASGAERERHAYVTCDLGASELDSAVREALRMPSGIFPTADVTIGAVLVKRSDVSWPRLFTLTLAPQNFNSHDAANGKVGVSKAVQVSGSAEVNFVELKAKLGISQTTAFEVRGHKTQELLHDAAKTLTGLRNGGTANGDLLKKHDRVFVVSSVNSFDAVELSASYAWAASAEVKVLVTGGTVEVHNNCHGLATRSGGNVIVGTWEYKWTKGANSDPDSYERVVE